MKRRFAVSYPRSKSRLLLVAVSVVALIEAFALYRVITSATGPFKLPAYDFQSTDDFIHVTGSWVSDSKGGTISTIPVNTADLSCSQPKGTCIEARAYRAGQRGEIVAQKIEYRVKRWSPEEVVAILGTKSGTFEVHLDRLKKVVTSIEIDRVEMAGAARLPSYAHMDDGRNAIESAKRK